MDWIFTNRYQPVNRVSGHPAGQSSWAKRGTLFCRLHGAKSLPGKVFHAFRGNRARPIFLESPL